MKYALKNIKSFITSEKMIFILILVCVITSSFIINFSYGLYQNYHIVQEEELSGITEIDILINDSDSVTKDKIKNCVFSISDETNDALKMYLTFPIIDIFYEYQQAAMLNMVMCRFTVKDSTIRPSEYFAQTLKDNRNMISRRYFTESEEINGDLVALVADTSDYSSVDITNEIATRIEGDQRWVEIQWKEYEVIGYHKQLGTPYFPFESLDEDTTFQYYIMLVFYDPLTSSQYTEVKNNFESTFGSAITVPNLEIPEPENYYLYNTIILISLLIAILAAINFAVLYKYILSKRTKTLAVFRICGCTKAKVLRMFLSECMIIAIPLFAATTLIYDKLVLPKLGQHFEYIESAYSIKLYLLIFGIYIAATLIVLMIMISSFLGKTIYESKGGK